MKSKIWESVEAEAKKIDYPLQREGRHGRIEGRRKKTLIRYRMERDVEECNGGNGEKEGSEEGGVVRNRTEWRRKKKSNTNSKKWNNKCNNI